MTHDPTEDVRRLQQTVINVEPGSRESLLEDWPQVWDTQEVEAEFNVIGFMAPYVVVRRKGTDIRGTLMFQHSPRFYFGFQMDEQEEK